MAEHQSATRILRRKQVEAETGLSRTTLYAYVAAGLWTRQVAIGTRAVGWPAAEVAALNAARIAGQDSAAIRELVARLHKERVSFASSSRLGEVTA